ncbi:MAG TPA: glycerate kinase [Gaiellaceae bacterium]|nr:glycerate kinase [Gaiellaceae bacterium]
MRVVAAPAPLKEVLSARDAAAALARGARGVGADVDEVPVADGGEDTAEVLFHALGGDWRVASVPDPLGRPVEARWLLLPDGRAVVESAQALGLALVAPAERDPLRASSRGLGELIRAALDARPRELWIALGGSATVDGGAGLREVVDSLPVPAVALVDVRSPLLGARGAARAFGPQKGADPDAVEELERRLAAMPELRPFADVAGAGAAGGLGAALAALGAQVVQGAAAIAEAVGLRERVRAADVVVTGEGRVDATTLEGKAPAAVAAVAAEAGVRCVVFGGRVAVRPPGVEVRELSGDRGRAREDLEELGAALARR